jgi:ferredoxin
MTRIRIQAKLCKKCGLCVEICPEELFVRAGPGDLPRIPRQKACIACGHCVSVCPSGAILHLDFPEEDWLPVER